MAFAVGVGLTTVWSTPLSFIAWLGILSLLAALCATRAHREISWLALMLVSVSLCLVALGMLRVELEPPVTDQSYTKLVGQEVELTGVVVREPDQREQTTHLYVDVGDVMILVYAERYAAVNYGDQVTLVGELDRPEAFTTELGRTFDYPGYLQARGVGYTMSFADVVVKDINQASSLLHHLYQVKGDFMDRLEQVLPEPQVGLGEGLLLGVKQALGEQYEQVFRTTGLMHIVVLSGYNVMLVVTFFMYVLAYILPFRWRLVVGVVAIAGFALLVGLSATVVRASIMASLLLLLRFTGNTYHILRALCVAGVVMLLLNPYLLLYDIGFQLSFMATLGLILFAERVSDYLTFMPAWLGLREFLTATLVTQVFVLPLLLFHIGEVSLVSVIVNVLVLPAVPVAMLLTFAVGLISYLSTSLALALAYLPYVALTYILAVARWFAAVPFAAITVPEFSWWAFGLVYGLIVLGAVGLLHQRESVSVSTGVTDDTLPDVSHWTIECESEVQQKAASSSKAASAETPVFFR